VNEMKKWRSIVSIMIVFALGALAGALVTHKICEQRVEGIIKGEPGSTREFIVRRLTRDLHLDANQQEQLQVIVRETHGEMRNVRKQFRPQIDEILARSQDKVRAVLRPDQREKYERIIAERKKKRGNEDNSR
jgi:hypothetical protein